MKSAEPTRRETEDRAARRVTLPIAGVLTALVLGYCGYVFIALPLSFDRGLRRGYRACRGCEALPAGTYVVLGDGVVAKLLASGVPTAGAGSGRTLYLARLTAAGERAVAADTTLVALVGVAATPGSPGLRLTPGPAPSGPPAGALHFTNAGVPRAIPVYASAGGGR